MDKIRPGVLPGSSKVKEITMSILVYRRVVISETTKDFVCVTLECGHIDYKQFPMAIYEQVLCHACSLAKINEREGEIRKSV